MIGDPSELVIEVTDIHLKVIQRFRMELDHIADKQLVIRAHINERVTQTRQLMPPVPVELAP